MQKTRLSPPPRLRRSIVTGQDTRLLETMHPCIVTRDVAGVTRVCVHGPYGAARHPTKTPAPPAGLLWAHLHSSRA